MGVDRETTDARIVEAVLSGRREAFGALVERYYGAAKACAVVVVGNATDAEDVVQEAFIRAYQSLSALKQPAKFPAWFFTIVRNTARSARTRPACVEAQNEIRVRTETPDPAVDEVHAMLNHEIAALDEPYREVVAFYYFAGKTTAEIAAILGVRTFAAQKRLQRARHMLGERLLERFGEGIRPYETSKNRVSGVLASVLAVKPAWKASTGTAVAAGIPPVLLKVTLLLVVLLVSALTGLHWLANEWWLPEQAKRAATPLIDVPSAPAPGTTPGADANKAPPEESALVAVAVRGAPSLAGLVKSTGGAPIAAATVKVAGLSSGHMVETQSDAGGRFQLTGLPEDDYTVRITHPLFRSLTVDTIPMGIQSEFVMEPAAGLEGRVIRADTGEPIEDFTIWFPDMTRKPQAVRLDEGRFRVDGVRWDILILEVTAPGFARRRMTLTDLAPGDSIQDVIVRLLPIPRILGRVMDASGAPVEDARVYANGLPRREERNGLLIARSGVDGEFVLENLGYVPEALVASQEGFVAARAPIPPQMGTEDIEVALVLQSGGSVRGRITAGGAPIPDAAVEVRGGSNGLGETIMVTTDSEGFYEAPHIAPGTVPVVATVGGALPHQPVKVEQVAVVEDGAATDVNFALPGLSTVSGRLSWGGEPVFCRVEFDMASDFGRVTLNASNRSGEFTLSGVPAGEGLLRISCHSRQLSDVHVVLRREWVRLTPGEEVVYDVDLSAEASIVGRVVGMHEHDRVRISVLYGMPETGSCSMVAACGASEFAADDGSFAFVGVQEGMYTVLATRYAIPSPLPDFGYIFPTEGRAPDVTPEWPDSELMWEYRLCESPESPGARVSRAYSVVKAEPGKTAVCEVVFE